MAIFLLYSRSQPHYNTSTLPETRHCIHWTQLSLSVLGAWTPGDVCGQCPVIYSLDDSLWTKVNVLVSAYTNVRDMFLSVFTVIQATQTWQRCSILQSTFCGCSIQTVRIITALLFSLSCFNWNNVSGNSGFEPQHITHKLI